MFMCEQLCVQEASCKIEKYQREKLTVRDKGAERAMLNGK